MLNCGDSYLWYASGEKGDAGDAMGVADMGVVMEQSSPLPPPPPGLHILGEPPPVSLKGSKTYDKKCYLMT